MKTKNTILTLLAVVSFTIVGCTKPECHECHYEDANNNEVELGEYCDDELEDLEANGYTDSNGDHHEVHCHEH